jgi:predicted lipid-binding transport protein (Tim44 family)
MFRSAFRGLAMIAIVAAAIAMLASSADDARIGGGVSSGSRGTRTFSAPPATSTAPSASPMQRSVTQPGSSTSAPGMAPSGGGLFSRPGLMGGLFGGLLTAGRLFGMMFGHGFGGGLGGFFSFIGLFLQVGLIAFVGMMPCGAFSSVVASRPLRGNRCIATARRCTGPRSAWAAGLGAPAPARPSAATDRRASRVPTSMRSSALLGEIQAAYRATKISARCAATLTPEMLSYFSEDLAQNASRGVINRVSDVKLLQGDLAEAWRESDTDYATVAMRFSLHDWMIDRTNGQVVDGDPSRPQEVTEFWTFRRSAGGPWILSAIQQV